MSLNFLQENWEKFAKSDPFWAVLTYSDKKGGKWKIDEFFKTGDEEIHQLIAEIGHHAKNRKRALDFGCGVGRLTQALAQFFQEVIGVDIAPSMIRLANEHNRYPKTCNFILNETNTLECFPNDHFDFIYSNITLQHMRARYIKEYLKEFLRILKPAGLAVFQLPSHITTNSPIKKFKQWLRAHLPTPIIKWWTRGKPWIDMNAIPKNEIIYFLKKNDALIIDVAKNNNADGYWQSFRYSFTK
ncbi:methyltransferase domain-containing protein [Candidatus Peregrinibacteria bacterium]|nr:methyltransferase domain-containing protein [Candidatus Peregrinibacteria bacterium]